MAAAFSLSWTTAHAAVVCSVDEFGCPSEPALCVVTGTWDVAEGCVLDFGGQDAEIRGTVRAENIGGDFDVRGANLTLQGGRLRSPGDLDESGGQVSIVLTGDLTLDGNGPQVDVGGNGGGGRIEIEAANLRIFTGNLLADGGTGELNCGDGGAIALTIDGALVVDGLATSIRANTGGYHCGGGDIDVQAATVDLRKGLDVSGGSPGEIDVVATTGDLVATAPTGIRADAKGSFDESGNDAGGVTLTAANGSLLLDADVSARGSGPDGWGGDIFLSADAGTMGIDGHVDVGAPGADTAGGSVTVFATGALTLSGKLLAKSGGQGFGGDVDLSAGGAIHVLVGGAIAADGGAGAAGAISLDTAAAITIDGQIDARGTNGGNGGWIDVAGCRVEVGGGLDVGAAGVGEGFSITIAGAEIDVGAGASLIAVPCIGASCVSLTLPSGTATIDPGAAIDPPAVQGTSASMAPCCGNDTIDDGTEGSVAAGEQCDDGNVFFCDGCTPTCQLEASPACPDDGNECTLDCSPASGCVQEPLTGVACADEPDICTVDVCVSGVCTHPPASCDDGIACTTDTCVPGVGCSSVPEHTACDDDESCTADVCAPGLGCLHVNAPDGEQCDDGSLCTLSDTCQSGVCTGPAPICDDGDPCSVDSCMDQMGCVHNEDAAACDCTDEGGLPLPAGTSCVDGNDCTTSDACDASGTCQGGSLCPDTDGDTCTDELCFFGQCVRTDLACPTCVEGEPCSDGDVCTRGICTGGVCVSTPISCDDGDPCTTEQCLPAIGCYTTNRLLEEPGCVGLDEFLCYKAKRDKRAATTFVPLVDVPLEDEFWRIDIGAKTMKTVCAPTNRDGRAPTAPNHDDYLVTYKVKASSGTPKFAPRRDLEVTTALGTLRLDAKKLDRLVVPASLGTELPPPPAAPHPDAFACYKVAPGSGAPKFVSVGGIALEDSFGVLVVDAKKPSVLCNPADLNDTAPGAPANPDHLLCFKVKVAKTTPFLRQIGLFTNSTVGSVALDAIKPQELCLPAQVVAP